MHALKSIVVLALLIAIVILSIRCIVKAVQKYKAKTLKLQQTCTAILCIIISCITLLTFGEYVYPFERTIDPELYIVAPMPEEYQLSYPGQKFWHGAYDAWFPYSESFYFDPTSHTKYGVPLPLLDFKHHSYIFTYGQTIEKLTYNVWNTIDVPFETGAIAGNLVLSDEFTPQMMFIYEIPKIRIENDLNQTVARGTGFPNIGNVFWNIVLCCLVSMLLIVTLEHVAYGQKRKGEGLREP